ncbi:extracellular solute-binding protein [Yoonia sp.]|uniref:ABC transporter substrate-binding protein n=1 Tax=Yoonia sp. TaxID=2212373 RepID=UPI0025F3916F|nr:extracellular solute-binding protein [Yoonia sp.]
MIRLCIAAFTMTFAIPIPVAAQEAVAHITANGSTPATELVVHSTTDYVIFRPALEAFVAKNPTVSITYEQWGSNALYAQSLAACEGDLPKADAVFSSAIHQMVALVNHACASPYRSAATAALAPTRRWRDELWGVTHEAAVIIYNTKLVPATDAPRTRFALLDLMRQPGTTYDGKIATYDIEASGLGYLLAFADSLEATTFGALLEGFARSNAVATCCSAEIIKGVADGRYLIAYNVLGSYIDPVASENIGVIKPEDYTLFLSRAYMIPRGARNPVMSAALLDFLLSPEGQSVLADRNLVDRGDSEDTNLPISAQRDIAIEPALLVAIDQHRRVRFIDQWRSSFRPK